MENKAETNNEEVIERYEGDFLNDMFHGKGTFYFANGNVYVGDWVMNKREGFGIFYFANGDRYEGEFKNNKFNGKGTYLFAKSGIKRTGVWLNDKLLSNSQSGSKLNDSLVTQSSGIFSPVFLKNDSMNTEFVSVSVEQTNEKVIIFYFINIKYLYKIITF
jgi:hypothetical protein